MRVAGASGDPFAKRNSVQRAPFKSKASFKEKKQPRDSPDSLDDEGDVVPAASNASRKDRRPSVDKSKNTPARNVLKEIRSSRLPKKLQVPNLDFDRFLRIKEREHQGAAVHDVRTARSGVLRSVRLGSQPEAEEFSFEDFAFFENSLPAEETLPSLASPRPGSRPGTGAESRQSARNREARLKLLDAQLEKELEENHDETFVAVAKREQLKQEYWQKYNEAGSAKKTLSEFEEWQRLLHGGKAEVSTTAPSEVEDLATSRISGLEQSDWRISHLGFTRRSEHEEYVSDYYRRCRERHYIPLGPRGSTPRQAKGHAHPVVDPVAVEPGVLDFGGWSLGSDRLDMLCQAPGALDHCTRCNLSENRIEDRSVPVICEKLLPRAQALNLSHNLIGVAGMRHFETVLRKSGSNTPLMELNLEGNRLGTPFGPNVAAADAYERDLCNFIDALSRAKELRALSVAQNQLGRVNHELGQALGQMVGGLTNLRVLDLHWNSFHGLGAYKLLEGIVDNRVNGGKLSRLDLSWNRLGMAKAKKLGNPAKMLADVLANNDQLFHLDISYNSIGVEDCATIASGLRFNSTLFGFHVAGNEAFVDELGFLVPLSDPYRMRLNGINLKDLQEGLPSAQQEEGTWTAEEVTAQLFGREVQHPSFPVNEAGGTRICWDGRRGLPHPPPPPPSESRGRPKRTRKYALDKHRQAAGASNSSSTPWEEWEDNHFSMPLAKSFEASNLETISFRAERCWICDRFQPIRLTWTPAVSGRLEEDEVHSVHAYVSTDDFLRPTVLRRVGSEQASVRFLAYRMVPKVKETLLVVFRVNGVLEVANDMPVRFLPCPVKVSKVSEVELASFAPDSPGAVETPGDESNMPETEKTETLWANEMVSKDLRGFPLVVTEDTVAEGKLEVYPRTVDRGQALELPKWDKAQSIFASWREADLPFLDKMLTADMKYCRIQKFAPDQNSLDMKKAIMPYYAKLVSAYRQMSSWAEQHQIFGASLHSLQVSLVRANVFDRYIPVEYFSSMAFAAHAVERKFAEEIKVKSDAYLIRYQFMETLMRLAEAKFLRTAKAPDLPEAMTMLLSEHLDEEFSPIHQQEQQFQLEIMTEEVDCVFKSNLSVLNAAFMIYAGSVETLDAMPYVKDQLSKTKRKITLPDFYEMLDDCDAYDERFLRRHAARAFQLGGIWQIDEVSSGRHMQLSFVEFIMAIGAVIFLREFYRPEEFADLLEEFLLDQLQPVVLEQRPERNRRNVELQLTHKTIRKVCKEVFEEADEDNSNALTVREFSRALRDGRTRELLMGKDFKIDEILKVFGMLDEDGSGELNFNEVLHGLGALLKVEQNEPRVRAFLRKELANEEGSGHFTAVMLIEFLSKSTTQRKLLRVGVDMKDLFAVVIETFEVPKGTRNCDKLEAALQQMFDEASSQADVLEAKRNFMGTIKSMRQDETLRSASDFTQKVLRLRKPKPVPRWRILIKQIFEQADTDQMGTLSREEFRVSLQSPSTKAKLESLGLDCDVIEDLFDVLDADGSDDVSEAEMLNGVEQLLEMAKGSGLEHVDMDELRARLHKEPEEDT